MAALLRLRPFSYRAPRVGSRPSADAGKLSKLAIGMITAHVSQACNDKRETLLALKRQSHREPLMARFAPDPDPVFGIIKHVHDAAQRR